MTVGTQKQLFIDDQIVDSMGISAHEPASQASGEFGHSYVARPTLFFLVNSRERIISQNLGILAFDAG